MIHFSLKEIIIAGFLLTMVAPILSLHATNLFGLSNQEGKVVTQKKPIMMTFQSLEETKNSESIVFSLEGLDIIKNISLLKNPLYTIDVAGEELTLDDLEKLKDFSPSVFSLNLSQTVLTNDGLKVLSKGQFKNLEKLFLSDNRFDDEGLAYLSGSHLKKLKELNIVYNKVTQKGIGNLSFLKSLEVFNAGCTYLGNAGIKKISIALSQIRILDVEACGFDGSVLGNFLDMPYLGRVIN
jgi:hypothetical protein